MATYLNGNEISIVTLGNNIEVDKLTTRINRLETELAIYTVKVLVNIDNKITEYYVEKGKTLSLDNPVKEDFTFLGWYVDLELIDLTTYIFNQDTVIVAQFEDNRIDLPEFTCNLDDFKIDGNTVTKYTGSDDYVEIPASYSIENREVYQDGVKVNVGTLPFFESISVKTLEGETLTSTDNNTSKLPDTFYLLNITVSSAYEISNMFYEYSDFPILFNGMVMNSYEEIDQYCMDNYSITDFNFQGNINKDVKVPGEDVLVTTLAEGTFNETSCYGVKISKNISSIAYNGVLGGMFGRNLNLSIIVVDNANTVYDDRNNCNAIIETATNKLMFGCKTTIIPDTVTSIGKNAFYLVPIIHVVIPASVKTIENQAFGYSRTILSATLLGNPTFSGNFVFGGCERLYEVYSVGGKEITFPSNINDIKDGCIARYAKVIHTSLDEPSNYTTINNHIYFIYEDEYIFMGVDTPDIKNITINPNTTTIAQSCFVGAGQVDTVSLTGCTKLRTLDDNAFNASWMCTLNFTELDFTDCINLSEVGWGIAYSNANLEKITMGAVTPPTRTTSSALFNDSVKQIMVPADSVSAYKQADGWSDYTDIIVPIGYTSSEPTDSTDANLFTFDGDTITGYTGEDTDIVIPTSYSIVGEETAEEEFGDFWMLLDYINMNNVQYPITVTDCDNIEYTFYDEMEMHDTLNMHAYPPFKMSITKPTYGNGTDYIVTSIGREAFQECRNLTSVTIPEGITTIGANAFNYCSSLTTLNLPKTLTNIDPSAFWYMEGLEHITMQGEGDQYAVINNALINKTESTLVLGCKNTIIPTNVTSIGQMAFAYSTISELVVPKNITTIGGSAFLASSLSSIIFEADSELSSIASSAFLHCRNLTTITIPKNVTTLKASTFSSCGISSIYFEEGSKLATIESQAFNDCDSLTVITFPDSVTTVAENAFYGCANIVSVTISKNITSIGGNICQQCNSLTTIIVESGNPVYDSRNNCNAVIETATNTLVMGCKDTNIPASVIHIGDNAFKNCYPLTSMAIPSSVVSIGTRAFYYCTQLASVNLSSGLTSIGEFAFYNCSALTNVVIPDSVTDIGQMAFWNCKNLVSVRLPANLTVINDDTFELCKKLSTINIPEGVTTIGVGAFTECNSLTSITLPSSLTSIGVQAFWVCSGLTTITIPAKVTSIGNHAFASCKNLTSMTMLPVTPPTVSSGTIPSNVTKIYIPAGSLSAYQSGTGWSSYASKLVETSADYGTGDDGEILLPDEDI